jgi:oligopeptidase A
MSSNPLLQQWVLPPYAAIRAEHVQPAIAHVLEGNLRTLASFLPDQLQTPSWAGLMKPLEDMQQRLLTVLQPIDRLSQEGHFDVAQAYVDCLERIDHYELAILQNQALQGALIKLQGSPEAVHFDRAQKATLDLTLRGARLAGVGFEPSVSASVQRLTAELNGLYRNFDQNTRQARQAWSLHITDESLLAGVSTAIKFVLMANASLQGLQGWLLTLDVPLVKAILSQAHARSVRQEVFEAYHTQASDRGPHAGLYDNGPIIQRILDVRTELAHVSGYRNYASRALATRMFETPEDVEQLLDRLLAQVLPAARQDLLRLNEISVDFAPEGIQYWDSEYCRALYRQTRHGIDDQQVREYLPLGRVVEGLGALTAKLFHVELSERPGLPSWDSSVRVFELTQAEQPLGYLYLDLYARHSKRPGAWMAALSDRHRSADGELHLPVALISCDFSPESAEYPTLIDLAELKSLLHEFGHGLHHTLTRIDHGSVAGIRGVADDAVEFPSMLFEQWAMQPESIGLMSAHYRTAEPMPAELLSKALAANTEFAVLDLLDQLKFSLVDYRLHNQLGPPLLQPVVKQVIDEVSVLPVPRSIRYVHTFGHLFTGPDYAAGYYTYVWSRVLAADVFQRFRHEGVLSPQAGAELRELILGLGGSWPIQELIEQFTQHQPTTQALLAELGIHAS